ncbi:MAG TPA: ABC transporter ATP-binding protein [Clostridia bacterium]|nr:ABC transporter ATP-binding protein [Clostridia bacterium]
MPLLSVKGLTKRFGGLLAVNRLDLSIEAGEILGLIGPNGAGKTTVFNVINGFYPADEGEIEFEGTSISRLKPDAICKKGIARAFQIVKPFGDMTVLDNTIVGALARTGDLKKAAREALDVLDSVGLWDKKDVLARSLTIADRKRLELARALATKPKLLLLDEVMAGLNPKEVEETVALVRKIRESGVTIFLIEHVMQAVMNLSERIVVLHHGSKIMEGRPQEVANDERVIKAYLGEEYTFARSS